MRKKNVFKKPEDFAHPISIGLLREILKYDTENGEFYWKVGTNQNMKIGSRAGSVNRAGYLRISIFKKNYLAHRLAWAYVHGEWPTSEIDHKDWVKTNNAIANLRIASSVEQACYRRTTNYEKVRGVTNTGRWYVAAIAKFGIRHVLGKFKTSDEAAHAYNKAAIQFFGDFAVLNPIGHNYEK